MTNYQFKPGLFLKRLGSTVVKSNSNLNKKILYITTLSFFCVFIYDYKYMYTQTKISMVSFLPALCSFNNVQFALIIQAI